MAEPEPHDHNENDGNERGEQTVSIEDLGPVRKRLTIEIPQERISGKFKDSYSRLKNEANVPGFRRGRAPMKLLERRFGTSVRDDVRGQLLTECYTQAVEDEKLDVIGEPDIQDIENIQLPDAGALTFKVEVEISPEVTLPDFSKIEVSKPTDGVTKEQVQEQIDRLSKRFGKTTNLGDAPLKEGDYASADVAIFSGDKPADDAEPLAEQKGTWVAVPGKDQKYNGHVAGIAVDNLGKQLIGKKAGETVRISLTGPSGHEEESIRDQPITIVIDLKSADRLEPCSTEELLKQLGFDELAKLKEHVEGALTERVERQRLADMREQVNEWLHKNIELPLPERLTGRQTGRTLRRHAMELAYRGVEQQEIEQKLAELRQSSEEEAKRRLKLFFILDHAAKSLEVDVSEAEVNGHIVTLAREDGRRPEKLRQQLQRSGEIEHVYLMIREQKTLDKIIEQAKITEAQAAKEAPKPKSKPKPKAKPKAEAETKPKTTTKKPNDATKTKKKTATKTKKS